MTTDDSTTRAADASVGFALLVRWVVTLHCMVLVAQLLMAVAFASGFGRAGLAHITNAWLVGVAGVVQALLIACLPGPRGSSLIRAMAAVVVLAEGLQIFLGLGGGLGVHVTTGMLVWALSLALLIRVWAPDWVRNGE